MDARALKAMLADGRELALIDVREELIFSQNHLLFARSVPLSRLELRFARLVPRRTTRIVLCDDADGMAERAAGILARAGYTDVAVLDGGVAAWAAAGFELFSGVNVPSKAFGEFVEHASATPSIAADELDRLIRAGTDMVVLDSRPFDEYQRVSIPTAVNVPGAELALRIHDLAPSPQTLVVVNCAGRTRSIIGAQSLINAGVPNKVVALRNGTMGWTLAGLACESGKARRAPGVSSDGLAWAKSAAARVADRFGITRIDRAHAGALACRRRTHALPPRRARSRRIRGRARCRRRLRARRAARAGDRPVCRHARRAHRAGRRCRGARGHDRVLAAADGLERRGRAGRGRTARPEGRERPCWARRRRPNCASTATASPRCSRGIEATVVDLSLSRDYLKAHIPGAWFAIRSRLAHAFAKIPLRGTLVLTSEDGVLAGLAAGEAQALVDTPVRALDGGNAAWLAAGHALTADDPRMADDAIDTWLKPYERSKDTTKAMQEYLSWEVDLLARIERDGSARFASRSSAE